MAHVAPPAEFVDALCAGLAQDLAVTDHDVVLGAVPDTYAGVEVFTTQVAEVRAAYANLLSSDLHRTCPLLAALTEHRAHGA